MYPDNIINQCPECAHPLAWSEKQAHYYCSNCGYIIPQTIQPVASEEMISASLKEEQPEFATLPQSKVRYCKICGRPMSWNNERGFHYCSNCGHKEYTNPPTMPGLEFSGDKKTNGALLKKKIKPKKKRLGCLGAIFKLMFSVILIVALIIAGITYWNKTTEPNRLQDLAKDFQSMIPNADIEHEEKEMEAQMKETPSDIKGMSQWDKMQQGLIPRDGSDTDCDGLTDKEEIEKYKTDPLNPSSSYDGIPDGIKVEKGLDLTKRYDIESEEYKAAMNRFPEGIKFRNIGMPENALANVWEKDYFKVAGETALVAYSVIGYKGTVDIDFTKHMESGKSYAAVLVVDGEIKALELQEGKISTQITKDCVIALIYAPEEFENSSLPVSFNDVFGKTGNDTMIVSLPILQWVGLQDEASIYVFENNFLKAGKKHVTSNADLASKLGYNDPNVKIEYRYHDPASFGIAQTFFNTFFKYDWLENTVESSVGSDKFGEVMDIVKEFMPHIVQYYDIKGNQIDEFMKFIESDGAGGSGENAEDTRPSKYVTSFNIAKDTLPFPNFGSYISQDGNCAGFASITMQLFNKDLYPKSDSRTFVFGKEQMSLAYDISEVEEAQTFFDRHLNDYKTALYWRNTYPEMDTLERDDFEENDAAFLDFIGFKWAEGNADVNETIRVFNDAIPWTEFEKLLNYFENNNKILYGIIKGSATYGAHAINVYGVEQDPNDSDVYYILVYDNNFPGNKVYGQSGNTATVDCRIKITRYDPLIGEDYIEWSYAPSKTYLPDYVYGSYWRWKDSMGGLWAAVQYHCLSLFDENWKIVMG